MISVLSPKIALGFVRTEISKQVGVKVERFEITYDKQNNEMRFVIYHPTDDSKRIDAVYDDDKLITILQLQIDKKAKNAEKLDGFVLEYNKGGSCWLSIFERDSNDKREVNKYEI